MGFFEGEVQVDKLWIYTDEKIIKKMYTYLQEYELEDERIKMMIKWVSNFGYNIDIDHWTMMWKECYKMIKLVNLRENILKMFYRWYYTL